MKLLKYCLISVLASLCLSFPAVAGEYEYDGKDFSDMGKMAGKLTEHKFDKLGKMKADKFVIVEFAGEFLQSKEVSNSVFSQRATGTTSTSTSTITLGNEYYNSVLNRTYDMIKTAFEESGFTVVPKENLTSLEKYKSLDLDFEKSTKGYTGSAFSDGVTTRGVKVSAKGLGLFPTSPMKIIKLMANLADLTNDAQANSALKVSFYIDKGKKGAPVLKSLDIIAYADLRGDERGFAGHKKMYYEFYKQNVQIFKLSKPMVNKVDISGPEKGSVDMEKYDKGLMELITAAIGMMKEDLKEAKK